MTATTATLGVLRRRWVSAGAARPPNYLLLVATVGVLNVVGGVMVLSASSVSSLTDYGSAWYFFERQVAWIAVAALAFMVTARIDYHAWRKAVRPLLVISVVLLVAVLVPGIGVEIAGSRRWLGTGMLRFQPTEIAKLAILVYTADLLARRTKDLHDWRRVLRPVLIVLAVIGALVLREPDLDSTIVLGLIAFAVLAAGGVRLRHLTLVGGTAVVAGTVLALAEPYRRARVFAFLHPTSDASNAGYQISQSLIALGSGGWTGVGLGAGRAKWLFLPNAHTDFIFAIIGEELGLVGCLLVVGLFIAFGVLGTRTALRAPDRFGMLLAAGITAWVVGQAAINIGAVIGLLPVSGIPLPFISFGGSALVFTMVAAGMLGNVARQAR
ncbi:MAG TPA: putative lipid II flippase FtsW [Acidimicrobiia bacterium]|nr:putative lipid II flippase FtsW [Acidimicrobiia bacterium]